VEFAEEQGLTCEDLGFAGFVSVKEQLKENCLECLRQLGNIMVNHTVSDFVTRIKNAAKARRREIETPYNRLSRDIAKVLVREGFLEEVKETRQDNRKVLNLRIKYNNRIPVITDTKIVSKPSLRVYSGSSNLVQNQKKGMYTLILSTSKGILTGDEAQKKNLGGEVLFRIW